MAAPTKQGLDYFPYSIGLLKDRKFRRVRLKFGSIAINIYLALLELIYTDRGYYIEYSANKDDIIWEILECCQGRYQPTEDTVSDVIDELVTCGLFSREHYPKILTSRRIQQVYYSATVERKAVNIEIDKWFLTVDEMLKLSVKSSILLFFDIEPKNEYNPTIKEDNQPNKKEKRKEEIKKEEIKKNNKREEESAQGAKSLSIESFKTSFSNKKIDCEMPSNIDIEKLIQAIKESQFLSSNNNLTLKWFVKNYDRVTSGAYRDFEKKESNKTICNSYKREYTKEELDALVDNVDDIEI